jgi:hypothetical protein
VTNSRPTPLRAFAAVACLVSLAFCFREGWSRAPSAMDLYGYYGPARVWLTGGDPYDRATFTAKVAELFPDHAIGETACPLLPSALTVLAPLALLPPAVAARAMWVVSFAALVFALLAAIHLWARGWTPEEKLLAVALLAQSRLIQSVAYRGQPSLLMLAAVLAALVIAERRPALAGAAAVVAGAKFTLGIPLVVLWAWQRRWRALLSSAGIGLALSLPPLLTIGPGRVLHGLLDSLAFVARYNETHAAAYHLTSLGNIARALPPSKLVAAVGVALPLGALLALLRRRPGRTDAWVFAGLTVLGLVALYHRVYDAVFLLPIAVLAWNELRVQRRAPVLVLAAALVLVLFVFAPQSVAERTAAWLAGHPPLALLAPVNAWACVVMLAALIAIVWTGPPGAPSTTPPDPAGRARATRGPSPPA